MTMERLWKAVIITRLIQKFLPDGLVIKAPDDAVDEKVVNVDKYRNGDKEEHHLKAPVC